MENYIKRITPEMTTLVNELKARNFESATPEEIEVYAEWSKLIALQSDELQQRHERRQAELNASIEALQAKSDSAIKALNALTALAEAKLKAVENGTQE